MRRCLVCEALPHHRGTHYTIGDVTTLMFLERRQAGGPAHPLELAGCYSPTGEQVMVSTHLPEQPQARSLNGVWIYCSQGRLLAESNPSTPAVAWRWGNARVPSPFSAGQGETDLSLLRHRRRPAPVVLSPEGQLAASSRPGGVRRLAQRLWVAFQVLRTEEATDLSEVTPRPASTPTLDPGLSNALPIYYGPAVESAIRKA